MSVRGLAPIRWAVVGLALGAAQSGELPVVLQGGDWVDELASSPFPMLESDVRWI